MPVSGIVATLAEQPAEREGALACLAQDGRLTLGQPSGLRLPVVIDTGSAEAQQEAWDAVERTPGVRFVELVYHDFSDVDEAPEQVWRRRRGRRW
jgi:nitrate reductase NapAB chaperone NapD